MSRIDPHRLDVSYYPARVAILARYADVDPLWHINNVALAQYFEEARVASIKLMFGDARIPTPAGERVLLAHQSVDYLHEAGYPGTLEAGIGVLRIGNTSWTLGMGVFQAGTCVSISDAVLVYAAAGGPARIPDQYRSRLESWLLETAASGR
jgi:acyl-CoA thioester hydrolase